MSLAKVSYGIMVSDPAHGDDEVDVEVEALVLNVGENKDKELEEDVGENKDKELEVDVGENKDKALEVDVGENKDKDDDEVDEELEAVADDDDKGVVEDANLLFLSLRTLSSLAFLFFLSNCLRIYTSVGSCS